MKLVALVILGITYINMVRLMYVLWKKIKKEEQ